LAWWHSLRSFCATKPSPPAAAVSSPQTLGVTKNTIAGNCKMTDMEKLFEVASSISTPLGLGGFLAAVLFYIFKQILTRDFLRQTTSAHSADIIKIIIDRLFVLALIAMVLGFIAYLVTKLVPPVDVVAIPTQPPQAASAASAAGALTPQAAAQPAIPICRHSSNGVERWGQDQNIPYDSGWRDGGSSPQEFCAVKIQERRTQYPEREITVAGTPAGESREEFFRHFKYRYTCTVRERWDPI
jgi:hypothetical protein